MLKIRRILVPIDFSEYCTTALMYGRELAAVHEASIDLLHIVEEPAFPAFYKMGEEAMYGDVSSLRDRALDAMAECAGVDEPKDSDEIAFHVEEGRPGHVIVEFAESRDSDLIVISTHGLSGIERVLMGSVAQKVIQDAPCPVFVIEARGKSLI